MYTYYQNNESTIKKLECETVESTSSQSHKIHDQVVSSLGKEECLYLQKYNVEFSARKKNFIIIKMTF